MAPYGRLDDYLPGIEEGWRLFRALAKPVVIRKVGIHGAARVKAGGVREVRLEIRAKEPPPRHADVIGWPSSGDDPDLAKTEQKRLAVPIAQKAGSPLRLLEIEPRE